jgi:hypothetical protein
MSLNQEFKDFVRNWLNKADSIVLADLSTYFDKFFTLYVVYNRLYGEVTFTLSRAGQINISNRTSFPDRQAATSYVVKFVGSTRLISTIDNDPEIAHALDRVIKLIERGDFSIQLDMVTGNPQRQKDLELLSRLRSTSRDDRANAILELIYSIRCNMFHGHNGFNKVQIGLLDPSIVLLRRVIVLLSDELANATLGGNKGRRRPSVIDRWT